MPSDRRIRNELIDELLGGASTEEEIARPAGILTQLTKRLVERAMEVELSEHVGYEPRCEPPGGAVNTRTGTSPKMLIAAHGNVAIDAPRDRDSSFEPQIVRKGKPRFVGFDQEILALYRRRISTWDIEAHLLEIYGVKVGRDLISRITGAVMNDVREWRKRLLQDIYSIVFLDCLVLKIRDGASVQRAARPALPWASRSRAIASSSLSATDSESRRLLVHVNVSIGPPIAIGFAVTLGERELLRRDDPAPVSTPRQRQRVAPGAQ